VTRRTVFFQVLRDQKSRDICFFASPSQAPKETALAHPTLNGAESPIDGIRFLD